MHNNIIICCAGANKRKHKEPRYLAKFKKESILSRQIRILNKTFNCSITVVTGFGHNEIKESVPKNINIVHNKNYETTNVAYSISLAINEINCDNAIVLYGDLIYNDQLDIGENDNNVIIEASKYFYDNVGFSKNDNLVNYFGYGLPCKWAQIVKLNKDGVKVFKQILVNRNEHRWFAFEMFNKMIDKGLDIHVKTNEKLKILDIDKISDMKSMTI